MDEVTIFFWVLGGLFVVSLAAGWWYLSVNVLNPDGKGAEKKTAGVLNRFALLRGFKVVSGAKVEYKDQVLPLGNVLVGYFGLLLVTTCGARGDFYGQVDGETWKLVQKGKGGAKVFPNPLKVQRDAMAGLRQLLSKHKIYNIPMEGVVVFTSRSNKTAIYITHGEEILPLNKLGGYLDKTKFEKDAGVDVEKLSRIILENGAARD